MKKLVLITSLFVCCAFIGACQSHSKSSTKGSKSSGSKKSTTQNSSSNASNTSAVTKKDTLGAVNSGTAVIHAQPNQAQIDSTKNAKTKAKK